MSFLDRGGKDLIGVDVYTIPQAAKLVRLRAATVEAIVGQEPDEETLPRHFPIVVVELDFGSGDDIITFQGLMELWGKRGKSVASAAFFSCTGRPGLVPCVCAATIPPFGA